MASGCRSKSDRSHQPLTFSDLRCLHLCHRVARPSFRIKFCQTGFCGVADRTIAANPHQCRIHETTPSFCDVLLYRLGGQALDRCVGCRVGHWLTRFLIVWRSPVEPPHKNERPATWGGHEPPHYCACRTYTAVDRRTSDNTK